MVAREPKTDIFGMNNIHLKFETKVTLALWGFLQLKSELIRKAETQKIREKQTNMALFLRRKSLNNLKNDE